MALGSGAAFDPTITVEGAATALAVAALALVVRPLSVWLCTSGTDFSWREKAFLSWVAPRGVVAAAIAGALMSGLSNRGRTT